MKVSFSAHAQASLVERETVALDTVLFLWVLHTSSVKQFPEFPLVSLSKKVQERNFCYGN